MNSCTINRAVVQFEDGTMGMQIKQDGEIVATLKSEYKGDSEYAIKLFEMYVGLRGAFSFKIDKLTGEPTVAIDEEE